MKMFEIESVEGVGYLVFEKISEKRSRRIDGVFKNLRHAREQLGITSEQLQNLSVPQAYNEMIEAR